MTDAHLDEEPIDAEVLEDRPEGDLLDLMPGLVRIAAGAYWRTAAWTLSTSLNAGNRLLRAATSGQSAAELVEDVRDGVRAGARELLGIADIDDRFRRVAAQANGRVPAAKGSEVAEPGTRSLRAEGAALLRRSADVRYEEDAHPAYARILTQLAPDEARILRFLCLEGPQGSVDVRANKGLNVVNSQLVAPGLSMIGPQAGARYLERVPAYLNNLFRLGLIWFSREPLEHPLRYQVLEAQPDVLAALRKGGRGRTVRRSIHLTPFGEDFCRTCLPLETSETDALGGGATEPGRPGSRGPASDG